MADEGRSTTPDDWYPQRFIVGMTPGEQAAADALTLLSDWAADGAAGHPDTQREVKAATRLLWFALRLPKQAPDA